MLRTQVPSTSFNLVGFSHPSSSLTHTCQRTKISVDRRWSVSIKWADGKDLLITHRYFAVVESICKGSFHLSKNRSSQNNMTPKEDRPSSSTQGVVSTSPMSSSGKAKTEARIIGSAVAGVSELALFHPVDTIAKRLMST